MANKEFDNVQLFAEYDSSVGSNVVNVFGNKSKENIAYSLSKIKNWFPWLVPTNGSTGQILEWYNNVPTWRANTNASTVKQTHSTDTDFHPLVLGAPHSASAWDDDDPISETTDQVYMNKGVYVKPSTSTIYATNYIGNINGFSLTGTSGSTYDLNSFITSQFISSITTTGNGNGVTAIGVNNGVMTVTKGLTFELAGHTHPLSIAADTGNSQLSMSANTKYKLTAGGSTFIFTTPPDSDTKVTSSANHYTPATASGQDKTASASGATAAWSIDVVKGVTLNTDGKGHVTGISVTSGKIPGNPVPSNNVTGNGTSGYLTKWNGTNSITNGPQLGSSTTTFLRNDGTWAAPLGTASKGSTTKGIYLDAGVLKEMTYSLNSSVNSGTANCIAYYSGANAISSAAKVTYVNANNSASSPATVAGLHIESPTYGNTAANMIGGVAGVFSYGDGGPQIRFKDASSTQAGALIFTADDAAATGTSWHFVSNETDWNVISKRFHAKTSISIGTDKPSTSYNLTVNGTSYFNNTITIKGTSSGNASINYASYGNTRNYTSIKFYDGDAYGQGVQVGGGGLTVVGGGESAQTVFDNLSTLGLTASSEAAVIASDGPIYFYTNVDTGIANRKAVSINTSGYLNTGYINMATSDEDNNFSSSSVIIYSNSDKYLRRTTFSKLASLLQTETTVYDGHVIHQNDYNSAGFTRPVHRFIRDLRPNKLAFTLPANITMEYSTNAGSSWTSFGYTDAQKAGPFISRHTGGYIAIGPTSGERTTSMQTRITITNDGRDCFIDQFYIWMSTSGHGTTVDIQYTTQSAKTTWVDWRMGVGLGGWAGPNIINVSELRYGNTIYSIRFTFKITSIHADYKTQPGTIYDIQAYGGMGCWGSKNNMMTHDSLFTWDYGQNATFPANVSATKFIGPLQGNADTATTATKLGTSTVGSGSRPIYLNAGTPTQCDTPTSGAYWNGVPVVGSNGVMEVGKYIDFHGTNTTTADYDYRIQAGSAWLDLVSPTTQNKVTVISPDYSVIQFQTTKTSYTITQPVIYAYPLTTSGLSVLFQSGGNTVIGGGESASTLYTNDYDSMTTVENESLYLASDSSEIHLITNAQSYGTRKVLKVQDAQLVKNGGLWISARDTAPVYANKPNAQDGGYYPAWFAKTKSGGWSMGVLSAQDNLYITYTTDTDYSGGSNTNTYQVQFQNKSGTVALTSDIPAADDHKVTQNNLTSGGTFPVILGGNTSAATVTDYVNKKYDTLRLGMTIGTTSTDGYGELIIGNATASGTAGNTYGKISIYSSNTAGAILRASSTTSWRSFYFPGDKGGTVAVTTDLAAYLPLSGGTMSGTITHPANTVAINLRNDGTSTWQNTIMTQSAGDEAVVFANANARTSWMFVNGEDSIAHPEKNRWQSLTPALQIKGGCVAIGKLIPSGTTPDIRLDIAGSAALTGDIKLKTTGSSSDDSGDIIWYYGNGKEKMRIWTDNTYTAAKGPNYRVYKSDGTLLYNGNLPLTSITVYSSSTGATTTTAFAIPSGYNAMRVTVKKSGSTMLSTIICSLNASQADWGGFIQTDNTTAQGMIVGEITPILIKKSGTAASATLTLYRGKTYTFAPWASTTEVIVITTVELIP